MAILQDLQNLSQDVDTARAGFFNTYQFGNLGMVNASHNTNYPLLHLLPPTSTFLDSYKNDEQMTCNFHCYRTLIPRETGGTTGVLFNAQQLEMTYDSLLEQFKGTMQSLLLNNEHKYIITGNWSVERINEEFNDGLVGIICSVQINKFTHCLLYQ